MKRMNATFVIPLCRCGIAMGLKKWNNRSEPQMKRDLFLFTMCFSLWVMPGMAVEPLKIIGADWPRVRHDGQLTGLSPLKGGLDRPPRELWSVDLGGPMVGTESPRVEDI